MKIIEIVVQFFRPFILDPANPFNNVCATFDGGAWNEVAQMARRSLASPLLQ